MYSYPLGESVRGMSDGLVIGLDFMGPFMTSVGGHVWLLNGTEVRGYCVARPVKDKTSETVLEAVKDVVRRIRVALGPDKKFKMNKIRIHSDRDSTLLSTVVSEWVSEQGWEQTTTAGYDHNAAARVERKNRKLSRNLRANLLTATGGNGYYKDVWCEGYKHTAIVSNAQPESGLKTPSEKLGGRQMDIQKEMHVFGANCKFMIPTELRKDKFNDVSRQGIWVGIDPDVSGGHRIIPITWNVKMQRWDLGQPVTARTVIVQDEILPLRMVPRTDSSVLEFDNFVDQFSSQAARSEVYIIEKLIAHRGEKEKREYRVKWKGWGKKDATWEPERHLEEYGAIQTLVEYKRKEGLLDVVHLLIEKYEAEIERDRPHLSAVRKLIIKHRLRGSEDEWLMAYEKELAAVTEKRMTEVMGDEKGRVQKKFKVIRLRMNPEPKKDGRKSVDC